MFGFSGFMGMLFRTFSAFMGSGVTEQLGALSNLAIEGPPDATDR